MGFQAFEREPVMWTSTRPDFNTADRQRTYVRHGRVVTERIPQTGSQGDYDNRQPITSVRRWLPMVNHGGHEVPCVFTNAAADLANTGPFAQYQWAMVRNLGWFWPGACPVALVATGELHAHQIVAASILEERPCDPATYSETAPCRHTREEVAARGRQNARVDADRQQAYETDVDRQIKAQREMNTQLIAAQGASQRELIEALLSRMPPPPPVVGLGSQIEAELAAQVADNKRLRAILEAMASPPEPPPPSPSAEPPPPPEEPPEPAPKPRHRR